MTPTPGANTLVELAERVEAATGPDRELDAEITVETTFRGPLASTLLAEAAARDEAPVALLADIVETVLGENLVTPVLDDAQ